MGTADEIAAVTPYTKSGPERLAAMAEALHRIDREGIPGAIVECGVWRGGNIILARKLSPERVCWLYDTFSGMTAPEAVDVTRGGRKAVDMYFERTKVAGKWAGVTTYEVRNNLSTCGVLDEAQVRFVEGPVEDTLLDPANHPDAIALLRLDTDWHASTKIELEVLYPLLSLGGVLIVDDYGHWAGARKAVDDYFGDNRVPWVEIDYTAVMMIKPC